jgi:hypothetical protein
MDADSSCSSIIALKVLKTKNISITKDVFIDIDASFI